MKRIALALILAATPIAASAKTWADDGCSIAVVSKDHKFVVVRDGQPDVACTVESWPIDQTEATLTCDNGAKPKMTLISDDEMLFDGWHLRVPTDSNDICD